MRSRHASVPNYPDYPTNRTADPYLNYISNRHIGRGTLDEYLVLFIRVIQHFSSPSLPETTTLASDSIQALLDNLVDSEDAELFLDTKSGSRMRQEDVEDTIMYMLGVWTMMLSSFVQLPNGLRKVTAAYNSRMGTTQGPRIAYEESLSGLIRGSRLLPSPRSWADSQNTSYEDEITRTAVRLVTLLTSSKEVVSTPEFDVTKNLCSSMLDGFELEASETKFSSRTLDDMDMLESLSIRATRLNTFTLNVLGAVEILWTYNVSRHLLLSKRNGQNVIELFALPSVFDTTLTSSMSVGIPSELAQEIRESYCILFNAWPHIPLHAKLGQYFSIRKLCWCWSCSAYRYRKYVISQLKRSRKSRSWMPGRARNMSSRNEFDPQLVALMTTGESSDWTHDLFPSLWPRITALEDHLQKAKPWSIWMLFRDRRDTLQFWTFLFASVVVILTFLQVALGVAQVVGSFR